MELFKPEVHLRKIQGTNNYCIHSITNTDNSQYRACGISAPVEVEGGWRIMVQIRQESNYPNIEYTTPVVHTTNYQTIPLEENAPYLFVKVENLSNPGDADEDQIHYLSAEEELGGID